jgi:hypothetical protein
VERVFHDACQKVVNLRTQMLTAMANITTLSSFARPTATQQQQQQQQHQAQTQSTSSIRMLAGSHLSSTSTNLSSASTIIASTVQQNGYSGSTSITTNGTNPSLLSPNSLANSLGFFQANPHLIVPAAYHSTLTNNATQSVQPTHQQQTQVSIHSQSTSAIAPNQVSIFYSIHI